MIRKRRVEVILAASLVIMGAFLARVSYIPAGAEAHVELAGERLDLDLGEPSRWFSAWAIGDGQAYAVIAADPTGGKLGEQLGQPAYRFSRAGFSWLAAAVTLGNEEWVPYGMAAVGLLSLVGLLVVAIATRERLGQKVWFLVLNPAIYLAFGGDTSESLGALLVAVALATGWIWAALAIGISRPSFLIALAGRWKLLGAGLAATVLLAIYSLGRFGLENFIPYDERIDFPVAAYLERPSAAGWFLAALAMSTFVIGILKRDWTWVATGLFVLSFGTDVTRDPVNAWRAAGLMPVLWAFGPRYQVPGLSRSRNTSTVGSAA